MEIKKYPHADLSNYRSLIFSISSLVTMSIMVAAFEWKQTDKPEVELVQKSTNTFETTVEIPLTEVQPPPPAVVTSVPKIIEVPDEEVMEEVKIHLDIEITQETRVERVQVQEMPIEEEEETNEIFVVVETPAGPKNGLSEFYRDIGERIKYPAQARRMRIEGRVFVEFVVNKDGNLTDFKVVKGIGAGCDEEALRVLQTADKWNPGKQRGKPVRQRMVLPITFKLVGS